MTFSSTSAIPPAFAAGADSGRAFSPAVLSGGSRPKPELAKPAVVTNSAADLPAGGPAFSGPSLSYPGQTDKTASIKSPATKLALTRTLPPTATAPGTRAGSVAAAAKSEVKKADLGEDGEIRLLKAQGENFSQIATDLSISVTDVNGDLETNIPKPAVAPPQDSNSQSTISVFA